MSNWSSYWSKKNLWQSTALWRRSSKLFYNKSKKYINFNNKIILDLGCGDGSLIDYLKNDVKKIYATDISNDTIKLLKNKHKKDKKVFLKKINKNFKHLNQLKTKFDIIICNSVVQYFDNSKEIINLIKEVKRVSKKNTFFLVSDIHTLKKKNIFKYIFYLIIDGLFIDTLNVFLCNFYKFNYRQYRLIEKNQNLLKIDYKKFKKILLKEKYNFTLIKDRLTTNYNSLHLLFKF
tara:strand:+ start:108 stop:809 length:702 start_codon:yes stop_codon:yes gene_type:complete